ncbi:MAG: twin transmembrane helix small protein [Alphaproteobacteria bacterium]|uniref:twin transmembrane helix small protein n=1 Tax=Brevundimonas sp. TaxID=1871086 RepID=UPI0018120C55|nr:twin transmembrane helix small protein [Brevundimonas sp.]MBA3050923.1 twin transmembrane helix small protein [Brevundimonas sp.]MBU3974616.1 twin transmembrane helix small protein [Alphaproteobacteria bacterium]MBU4040783.1 twin transmembrane helix small protein [Alphaproteobacteria bacterium]MBU4137455.1 twin transmembrane helix small protein [Alphaproteobacteria bacterium]
MGNLIDILILVAILAVAVTLGFGLWSMYRGGEQAASRSNKLMRLRVALQAVAIVLLCVGMWWKSTHAG